MPMSSTNPLLTHCWRTDRQTVRRISFPGDRQEMISKPNKSLVAGIAFAVFLLLVVMGITTLMPSVFAENDSHSSVTGYFGLDDDGLPIIDRHGIMLVFDGEIAPETVSVDTFEVSVKDGSFAEIVETQVDGAYVFLNLEDELASDATPIVGIAEGEEVEDLAGNSTNKRKLGFVQIKDGIAPRLTVTLSGGSGIGTGDEGSDRLTKDTIDLRITSDEALQGAPRVVVVCESLNWAEGVDGRDVERDIDDFIANRNGAFPSKPQEPRGTDYTCGYDEDGDGMKDPFQLTEDIANSRSGEVWEYTWRNPAGSKARLHDGQLVVVAYGRDKSRYDRYGEDVSNWSTAKGDFGFDTRFGSEGLLEQVKIHPPDGSVIREPRPFVLLEFSEASPVNLASVIFDGEEIVDEFEAVRSNEFVYWPLSMNQGQHSVQVEAKDSAGNETDFKFRFETTQRGDFVLPLVAGWNAVSVPADPIDPAIEKVFTDSAIEAVVSWDPVAPETPWSISHRDGDAWRAVEHFGPKVSEIVAGRGYWVKSSRFIRQPIALAQTATAGTAIDDSPCPSNGGWCFVGVTDKTGIQTQENYGEPLRNHDGVIITAGEYLRSKRNFVWEPIAAEFHSLAPNDAVTIGVGIWVWYHGSCGSCP